MGVGVLSFISNAHCQNFIPDSSFEKNKFVPILFSEINASNTWNRPSFGTSDLFCKCEKKYRKRSLVNVPSNPMGNQKPRSGNCYAGLFGYSHGNYREYLQTPLKEALEKNKTYLLKIHISLADYSRAAIDQLGVCFLTHEIKYKNTGVLPNLNPVYLNIKPEMVTDTVNWQCLTALHTSLGNESYMIIGSFAIHDIKKTKVKAPKKTHSRINQSTERDAYYYIDDVSLIEMEGAIEIEAPEHAVNNDKEIFEIPPSEVPMVLKNVLFNTNEAILFPQSFPELDQLVSYLKTHPTLLVEITGHTDSSGKESHNQEISEQRAKIVANYLWEKGVDTFRITAKGYGSSKPIATNKTKEGKLQNRRVEFRVR